MLRHKIDYGIDLGTTNSSIARMENGEPRIIKNPQTQMDTTPSAIHYTGSRQLIVGLRAYQKLESGKEDRDNTFIEFKRTMGTDCQYYSSRKQEYYSSERLSAEILKELKSFVRDEEILAAVISVPADFLQFQIDATQKAAEMAGFEYCELLQEPIAASLAYGFDRRRTEGYWLVFDFGGGTFDVALVKMDEGIIRVVDQVGDNHLGGKNMDWLIVDNIIIPFLKENSAIDKILQDDYSREDLRSAFKLAAEGAKKSLSMQQIVLIEPGNRDYPVYKDDRGKDIDAVIKIERSSFENLIERLIGRAIKMTTDLIVRNHLSAHELKTVIMVGGPTYISYLCERIKEEITERIDLSIDPMTVVARGAAIFASTISIPLKIQRRGISTVQLDLGYPDTTVETEIKLGIKIDRTKTTVNLTGKLLVEISRSDKAWETGKIELVNDAALIRLHLSENKTNGFAIQLYDEAGNRVDCEPNSFSILQGIKIGSPTLPHDIGISAVSKDLTKGEYFSTILKKNQTLPAVGKGTYIAPKMLRPGKQEDVLNIVVWEGKAGTKPTRNELLGTIEISGDKLPSLLPEGNDVEITIRLDESRRMTVSAYIPYLDKTFEEVFTGQITTKVQSKWVTETLGGIERTISMFREAFSQIDLTAAHDVDELESELREIEDLVGRGLGDYDRGLEIKNRIRELQIRLDDIEKDIKWPLVEQESKKLLEVTKDTVEKYGSEHENKVLGDISSRCRKALEDRNVKQVENMNSELQDLKWSIWFKQEGFWISTLKFYGDHFDEIHWKDRLRARNLVSEGLKSLAQRGYSDEVRNAVTQLWELMPEEEKVKTRGDIPHSLLY